LTKIIYCKPPKVLYKGAVRHLDEMMVDGRSATIEGGRQGLQNVDNCRKRLMMGYGEQLVD
jgi:hypothetical protein